MLCEVAGTKLGSLSLSRDRESGMTAIRNFHNTVELLTSYS